MKTANLSEKVQAAIDVLGQYEIPPSSVAPFWYRQYLRFKPETPPPLWGASRGYWDFLTFIYTLGLGTIVVLALGYWAWQEQTATALALSFSPFTQVVVWSLAGLPGWAMSRNNRLRCRIEHTNIGLPQWEDFRSDWRISSDFLQQRITPERYWLRSLIGKPIFNQAAIVGAIAFALLAWALPMKVGSISEVTSIAYLVICLTGLARTEQGKAMPANPGAWQCTNGFWMAFTIMAILWTVSLSRLFGVVTNAAPLNWGILVYGGGCLLFFVIELVRYERQSKFMQRVGYAEQKKQLVEAQLRTLKAQIEPHFIFNTIAHLKSLIASDPKMAERMADELSDFLRASLKSLRADWTTVAEDIALARAYLELSKLRMGSRLSANLQLTDNARNVKIPPLMLQTLLENAIGHGIEPKVGAGHVAVTAEVVNMGDEPRLRLRVADDGVGFGVSNTSGAGVGLANIRERLASAYGGRATFTLTANTPSGVIAELDLPMEKTDNTGVTR